MAEENVGQETQIIWKRAEDFFAYYANNVIAESTAWDMRLTFGQFDNVDGHLTSRQQVAVTMSFGLAKLMIFYIESQIVAHEIETGAKVRMRDNLVPPPIPPVPAELQNNPQFVKLHDEVSRLRARLLASME